MERPGSAQPSATITSSCRGSGSIEVETVEVLTQDQIGGVITKEAADDSSDDVKVVVSRAKTMSGALALMVESVRARLYNNDNHNQQVWPLTQIYVCQTQGMQSLKMG